MQHASRRLPEGAGWRGMMLYGITIFLGAFLLFLIQPVIGKYLLPWFGGTPAVWTTCMLFFQALLLGGYAYAHALARRWSLGRQAVVHAILAGASLLSLPAIPSQSWKVQDGHAPELHILGLLLLSIGAPYFLLSATSPLLQSWFSRIRPGSSPYRLYALSNLGSLLAIVLYPFFVEPALRLNLQAILWSWAYAGFVVFCIVASMRASLFAVGAGPLPAAGGETGPQREPGLPERVLWLGLPAVSCLVLLATTNQMCQDVAVVPLLWILPLALYLLSFILCFQYERLYRRRLFLPLLVGSLLWSCFVLQGSVFVALRSQILSYSLTLFAVCMVCHGELVRLKPAADHLTSFYLMVAGGGALGGAVVTVLAPILLTDYWEYHLGLVLTVLLVMVSLFRDERGPLRRGRPVWAWALMYLSAFALVFALATQIRASMQNTVETARNFFGVLRVLDLYRDNPGRHRLTLMHGRIEHGFQFQDPEKRYWPTSYFGPDSGVGVAICFHPTRLGNGRRRGPLRIGVVGLGTGTLASYGTEGDYFRFYEINPDVIRLSDRYFTYRRDSPARIDVVVGDARISLERERQFQEPQGFDILAVDAFSSDAIPVHLLTRECLQTYLYHLSPDGILAMHISNRYFDLSPVVRYMASLEPARGMEALWVDARENEVQGTDSTDWILLTANRLFLADAEVRKYVTPWKDPILQPLVWTDDYSNLFSLLRR
jgi:hypothetical protein